ncbi:hypothetical protein GCM10018987_60110 [Streptomyces cremeus]
MVEDALVQGAQGRAGFEAEFVGEVPAQFGVALKRFGVPSGAVQGAQQQGPAGFPQGVLGGQLTCRVQGFGVPAQQEQRGGAELAGGLPQLLQPGGLLGDEQVVRRVGERGAAPQPQRGLRLFGGAFGLAPVQPPARLRQRPFEACGVTALGRDPQGVAERLGDQQLEGAAPAQLRGFQDRAQLADVRVQGVHRSARRPCRLLRPQFLAQHLGRHRPAVGEQQAYQQQPLPASPRIEDRARPPHHQRTQQPEVELLPCTCHRIHPESRSTAPPPGHVPGHGPRTCVRPSRGDVSRADGPPRRPCGPRRGARSAEAGRGRPVRVSGAARTASSAARTAGTMLTGPSRTATAAVAAPRTPPRAPPGPATPRGTR